MARISARRDCPRRTSSRPNSHYASYSGTKIATPSGDVRVERLEVGGLGADRKAGRRGRRRHLDRHWTGCWPAAWPAQRGDAGHRAPRRAGERRVPTSDLHVTKGHSLLIDGVLIPVELLINHRTILWDDRAQQVTIYHIELATHDVLLANGAPAESYRDDGNRWLFQNANPGWANPGWGPVAQEPCAPVQTGGKVVDAIWRRSRPRAPAAGCATDRRPRSACLGRWAARRRHPASRWICIRSCLPRPPAGLRIVSRAGVPQELGTARDPGPLGVAVLRIVRQHGRLRRRECGRIQCWSTGSMRTRRWAATRWTDGDAAPLPATAGAGFTGPGP